MKTEDLKNYIFEQLTETSDAAAKNLEYARFNQGLRASSTSDDIHNFMMKKFKKTGQFDTSLTAVRDIFSKKMLDRFSSATKAGNRRKGRKGDGSPRTPTQESAFNFINGLKRLSEENSEHTRIDKMSLPEKKKFYNAIKREKVSDQEDREERRERLDLIKHARNSIKNHQDSTT